MQNEDRIPDKQDALDALYHQLNPHGKHRRMLKDSEDSKTESTVFDKRTVKVLYKAITDGIISNIDYPISEGKEAVVFRATALDGSNLAVKVYLMSTSSFKKIGRYIAGDPRFKNISGRRQSLIYTWAKKEYKNLSRMEDAGVAVPTPIWCRNNVLIMDYIGNSEAPAPLLKDYMSHMVKDDDERYALSQEISIFLRKMVRNAHLVHADLSEFNILVHEGHPVIIDAGQAVVLSHPDAISFLKRDINNITRFFKNHDIDLSGQFDDLIEYIRDYTE